MKIIQKTEYGLHMDCLGLQKILILGLGIIVGLGGLSLGLAGDNQKG